MVKNIHFIGIGGSGMSGLAGILKNQGNRISGSDQEENSAINDLKTLGIPIKIGNAKKNIPKDADMVIYSLAILPKNPELMQARRKGLTVLSYPEAVGELTKQFFTIAVCGTHGKSTITAMISKILIENQFDPTVLLGATMKELHGKNYRVGRSKLFVLEACEYRRAFLHYSPSAIILNTLDPDHLDYYRDFDDYLSAFRAFVSRLRPDGYFFGNLDDEDVHAVMQHLQQHRFPAYNTFTYSTRYSGSDFYLSENKIIQRNARVGNLDLKIPGLHNRTNGLAAFAVGATLGISPLGILHSLNRYAGASRRFEFKGKIGHALVISDYAHHPTEIEATLQAAREKFPSEHICAVFQPHQYNRTKKLLKEFGKAFREADYVIIPNIYDVRDSASDRAGVGPERLVSEIVKNGTEAVYGESFENTIKYLRTHAKKFDVIFVMGAGDVWKVADGLVGYRRSR